MLIAVFDIFNFWTPLICKIVPNFCKLVNLSFQHFTFLNFFYDIKKFINWGSYKRHDIFKKATFTFKTLKWQQENYLLKFEISRTFPHALLTALGGKTLWFCFGDTSNVPASKARFSSLVYQNKSYISECGSIYTWKI